MRRIAVLILAAALAVPTAASADLAEDRRICLEINVENALEIAACTRLLDAGGLKPADEADILLNRGLLFHTGAEYQRALADYDRAIALVADDARLYRYRGDTRYALEQYALAADDYRAAIALNPGYYYYHTLLAYVLYQLDRNDEALAALDEALRLDPDSTTALYLRGFIHLQADRNEAALADFTRGTEIDPFDADFHDGRGRALFDLGDRTEALRAFRVALLLDPNLDVADFRLEELAPPRDAENRGPLVYEPPAPGLAVTYLEVIGDPVAEVDDITAAINALIGWFARPDLPLPTEWKAMRREIGTTAGGLTAAVETELDTDAPATGQNAGYVRSLWTAFVPAPPGFAPLTVVYDGGVDAFWRMAPGETTRGTGDVVLTCPATPNPLGAIVGCLPGVTTTSLGRVTWEATFERWEYVTVPAGQLLTARIRYTETRALTLLGRTQTTTAYSVWWFDPEIDWWVRRQQTVETRMQTVEAWYIERPAP